MPRPKTASTQVKVTLPAGAVALLDQVVGKAQLGETRADVARVLLVTRLYEMRNPETGEGSDSPDINKRGETR